MTSRIQFPCVIRQLVWRAGSASLLLLLLSGLQPLRASGPEEKWVSLFNGQDLSGWVPITLAPRPSPSGTALLSPVASQPA